MSKWQDLANKLFVRSARYRQVIGDGEFVLLSKCPRVWMVRLYPTKESRDEAWRTWNGQGCGKDCSLAHDGRRLSLPDSPLQEASPFRQRDPEGFKPLTSVLKESK
jgi:hypothetical protein